MSAELQTSASTRCSPTTPVGFWLATSTARAGLSTYGHSSRSPKSAASLLRSRDLDRALEATFGYSSPLRWLLRRPAGWEPFFCEKPWSLGQRSTWGATTGFSPARTSFPRAALGTSSRFPARKLLRIGQYRLPGPVHHGPVARPMGLPDPRDSGIACAGGEDSGVRAISL